MVRQRDALPEYLDWPDRGCEVAPHCLQCPLARCKYDVAGGARALAYQGRQEEVVRWQATGMAVPIIAEQLHLSQRSVFRILQGHRDHHV